MSIASDRTGHAFLSYAREDKDHVDRLQQAIEAAGIVVWRDISDLRPGQDWQLSIRRAITNDALAFVACFSRASVAKFKSYQNDELLLAIDQFRQCPPGQPWLIPVRFDDCGIPDFELGGGRTLASIQRADLFGDTRADHMAKLIQTILQILGRIPASTTQAARPPPAGSTRPGLVTHRQRDEDLSSAASSADRAAAPKAQEQEAGTGNSSGERQDRLRRQQR